MLSVGITSNNNRVVTWEVEGSEQLLFWERSEVITRDHKWVIAWRAWANHDQKILGSDHLGSLLDSQQGKGVITTDFCWEEGGGDHHHQKFLAVIPPPPAVDTQQ